MPATSDRPAAMATALEFSRSPPPAVSSESRSSMCMHHLVISWSSKSGERILEYGIKMKRTNVSSARTLTSTDAYGNATWTRCLMRHARPDEDKKV